MHLRAPSIDRGVQSFLWAAFFFALLWFGMMALGVRGTTAFVLGAVSAFLIFLFVRMCGDEDPTS